ncbi:SIS domain-containing protein [Streptomyces sp. ACA25]|uniref:SIS domain-containing protein n=1 Tax=Streptomyces sp. ACA25 TaxID=3022596 RepID=UPI002306FC83|nr:SIS domain-containing protein [Streptomyces sp. ACA25]MDB1088038.1 SIS domain-containing protein [Streptomyces sp. ACA25]
MAAALSRTAREIAAQPDCWRLAARHATGLADALPEPGERVAVTGCGTSWFMAQAYAALREQAGQGETHAFAASEFPMRRTYDRVVAITRSGTTSEVLRLLEGMRAAGPGPALVALTADPGAEVIRLAEQVAVLDYADEESVVQTRFATSALALLRAGLEAHGPLPAGVRTVAEAATDAERALSGPLPAGAGEAEQWTFLGSGWVYGLAQEAALKMREAAGAWAEAYPSMEYRHGPVAITAPGRAVWLLDATPDGPAADVLRAGGTLVEHGGGCPTADLVRVQRLAVAVAESRGLDPDRPRNLSRSVILP